MPRDEDKPVKVLRRFTRLMDRALQSCSPRNVHNLRTGSRRLEATIHAVQLEDERPALRIIKIARRLRKRAGRVRDRDVSTEFIQKLAVPGQEDALAQFAEHLSTQRKKAARRLKDAISDHRKAAKHALKQYRTLLLAHAEEHQEKIESAADRLQGVLAASPRISQASLHDYRIKLKELRYTLELLPESDPEFSNGLAEVTGAIGEWHDWGELQSLTVEFLHRVEHRDLLNAIRSTTGQKLSNALSLATELHKRYFSKAAAH